MPDERTNLLPPERQRTVRREYFLRLATVGALLALILVLVGSVLLIPTFVFLTNAAGVKQNRLASIESALSSSDERQLSERLATLSSDANILVALKDAPTFSGIVQQLLALPRPGITLVGMNYTAAVNNKPGTLDVSGIAATRETLRSYQLALTSTPFATSADLPVSAYAKDSNISFTITLTLSK